MPKRPEDAIQRAIVQYLQLKLSGAVISHARNEGNRGGMKGVVDGRRGKLMGVKAGFPDLVVFWQGDVIFFEVKAPGGYLNEAQRRTRDELKAQGFKVYLVRSIDDAADALADWEASREGMVSIPFRGIIT